MSYVATVASYVTIRQLVLTVKDLRWLIITGNYRKSKQNLVYYVGVKT